MRTFKKPNYDWTMPFYTLDEICQEVYGVPYDLQMGERGQGEYDIVTTGEVGYREGYHAGLGQGDDYDGKYIEGNHYVFFDEGVIDPETGNYVDVVDKAIAHWQAQEPQEQSWGKDWGRPFDKVGKNGQYTFWQPSLSTVMTGLARRLEIPEGTYMITIDW